MKVRMVKVEDNKLRIDPRDLVAFDRYKEKIADGTQVTAEFRIREDDVSERASHYFYVLRDKYAAVSGYDRDYAKNELCVRFGVSEPVREDGSFPFWVGQIIEMYGKRLFRKSVSEYTKDEMHTLIEGTIMACIEADVPVAEVVADYRRGV